MTTVVQTRFRLRRDTAANWTSNNPVLLDGEPALETDTRKVKYGDGSTAWNSLPYDAFGGDASDIAFTPAGGIAATDVQAAIEELDDEKVNLTDIGWTVAGSWTHSSNVTEVVFTNLGDYQSLIVMIDGVTLSASNVRRMQLSTNNGSTWYGTAGDYKSVDAAGVTTDVSNIQLHTTSDAAARTAFARMDGNVASAKKHWTTSRLTTLYFAGSTSPINAIRIWVDGTVLLTGGSIQVLGLQIG